jgi:DHA2 family multidrug resistance protein
MIIFFIYSMMAYRILTPSTGSDAFFWILVIRGVGLGLLSIPVTTMALSTLKGKEIGQGAALSGMLRQLGGSFGVALISTFLTRDNQLHRADLVSKLSTNSAAVQRRVYALTSGFQAKGMSSNVAHKSALELMDRMVNLQAVILSYMDVFLWIGVMFLVCVPFVIALIRESKNNVDMAHALQE